MRHINRVYRQTRHTHDCAKITTDLRGPSTRPTTAPPLNTATRNAYRHHTYNHKPCQTWATWLANGHPFGTERTTTDTRRRYAETGCITSSAQIRASSPWRSHGERALQMGVGAGMGNPLNTITGVTTGYHTPPTRRTDSASNELG